MRNIHEKVHEISTAPPSLCSEPPTPCPLSKKRSIFIFLFKKMGQQWSMVPLPVNSAIMTQFKQGGTMGVPHVGTMGRGGGGGLY